MPPLYVSEAIPAVAFWAIFVSWYVLEISAFVRLGGTSGAARDRGSRLVLITCLWSGIFIGFALAFTAQFATITFHRHVLFYSGLVLIFGGAMLRVYAIAVLGHLHTMAVTTHPGQPVIDSGPYRLVRHPSYAGALITAAGILLCSTNWLSLACFALIAGGYAYRILIEEKALVDDLGQPYRDYVRRTKRLIPFLL